MIIIEIIGFMLLFIAVDYGRKEDSKITLLSWKFLIIWLLIVIGSILIQISHEKTYEKNHPKTEIQKEQTNYKL